MNALERIISLAASFVLGYAKGYTDGLRDKK